jgi:hypothetical protein
MANGVAWNLSCLSVEAYEFFKMVMLKTVFFFFQSGV